MRADVCLVSQGIVPSREKAKELILQGRVYANGQAIKKAALDLPEDTAFEVRGNEEQFVSRGGHKLLKAVREFGLDLNGCTCMDIGASTGGFTDCMLQHGAKKVYAVDVGTGQLAEKLLNDQRVVNMEKTNIRQIDVKLFACQVDFISIDVSFISLSYVFPVAVELLKDGGECVALVKPQFEAGRNNVGKKGVVKDEQTHIAVAQRVCALAKEQGFAVKGFSFSPIKGPEGNIEYLLYLKKCGEDGIYDIKKTVKESHHQL